MRTLSNHALDCVATELQQHLALVDLLTEPGPHVERGWEFLVLKLRHLKIKMYQEMGHSSPHIHIDYGREQHVASYSIGEARRLAGTLDTKYDREVVALITKYRSQLLEVWHSAQAGDDPRLLIAEISDAASVS